MNITPQIVLTLDRAEYAQFALVIDYMINDDAVITPEMYAFAVNTAIRLGIAIKNQDLDEDPAPEDEPTKLH